MNDKNKFAEHQENSSFKELEGKILTKIEGLEPGSYEVLFYCNDGTVYKMYPEDDTFLYGNDCVTTIDDVCGEPENLIGEEIRLAAERQAQDTDEYDTHKRWTFYTLATIKGYVDIRWYGEHNGYYSDEVEFYRIETNNDIKN